MNLHSLSEVTLSRLAAQGLSAEYVQQVIRDTVSEDLDGGIDITSVATVPLEQRSVVTFGSRANGCLAGLDIAIAAVEMVCGPAASNV
jgi:nicotinate-nucleotide pyrophosphorylase (carboxylating)